MPDLITNGLRFAYPDRGYIVHNDTDGDDVPTTPYPIVVPLTMWADFDLPLAWLNALREHRESTGLHYATPDRHDWWETVRRTIAEGMDVEIIWCPDCNDPADEENSSGTVDGSVCHDCLNENYRTCDDCGEFVHYINTTYVNGDYVCSGCADNYPYCEDCDAHYHVDDASDHQHGGCNCEPGTHTLGLPHGTETVTANERVTLGLPAGIISDVALGQIGAKISRLAYEIPCGYDENGQPFGYEERNVWWNLYYALPQLGAEWQTREGNYTKRLSKLAHKSGGLKIPAEIISEVGNIARDNSKGVDFQVEFTRDLNLPAEDFYHEDSCWWQSYSESRCSLKNNGGMGMRTFGIHPHYGTESVQGRAWVQPLREVDGVLQPTFDGIAADAFMVYNGYGDLSGYAPARLVAAMVGKSYRKVDFRAGVQYINSGGYLVASEEVIARHTNGVDIDADEHSSLYTREWATARLATLASV